jgi:6-phosphogluconolactonase (cycloisomerase 2 family)
VEAAAQPNYTTLRVTDDGRLSPIAHSTITATASPSQALAVSEESRYDLGLVFGDDFEGGNLQSFELGRNGILRQNPPQPLPSAPFVGQTFQGGPAPPFPLGLGVYPELPILYVGFVTINEIGVYSFGPDGALKFVRTVSNPSQGGNCWIVINPDGTRMYIMDTGTNQITVCDVATDPLMPRALGVTQLAGTGFGFEMALSDNGRYLQAISQQGAATGSVADNTLHVLRVGSTGLLTEVETDSLTQYLPNPPVGTRWLGVVAF